MNRRLVISVAASAALLAAGCATLPSRMMSPKESVRQSAYLEAARLPRSSRAAVAVSLQKRLKSKDPIVRERAVRALAPAGPVAAEVVRDVVPLLDDASKEVRLAAVNTLPFLGTDALTGLASALRSNDSDVRDKAVEVLGVQWNMTPATLPALAAVLKDSRGHARLSALKVFIHLGPRAQKAVPDITWLLTDPDKQVRLMSLRALTAIGGEQVKESLVRAMQDSDPEVRSEAIRNLTRLKVDSDSLRALLVMYSDDEVEDVAVNAVRALGQLGPLDSATLASVGRAFKDSRARVHDEAGKVLAGQGRAALPVLSNIMMEERGDVESRARKIYGRIREGGVSLSERKAPVAAPAKKNNSSGPGLQDVLQPSDAPSPDGVCVEEKPCP